MSYKHKDFLIFLWYANLDENFETLPIIFWELILGQQVAFFTECFFPLKTFLFFFEKQQAKTYASYKNISKRIFMLYFPKVV